MPVLGRVVLGLPVVVAPLLSGTAERPYTLWVAALGALVGLGAAVRVWRRSEALPVSFFAAAIFCALVATLLQCVPLPPGLRAALAPGSDATLRQLLASLGDPAAALPLSVDPAATANEAVRLAGYLSLLLALGTLRQRRGHSVRLGRVLCGTSSLIAALGALAALGVPLPALWAVPADGATRALLPAVFYNSNHMAALLAVGGTVTVGAALQAAGWGERVLCGLLLALQDLALLGTLSRAGILVGLGGQLIVLLSCRWSSLRARPLRSLLALALPLLAAGLGVLGSPGWRGGLRQRFAALTPAELLAAGSKVRAWLDALPLLRGHWAFGVGRGAFEDAFAGAHRLAGATRFVYLENQWLQAVVDWGVPVGLGLGVLVGLGLRDAWRELGRRATVDSAGAADLANPHAPGRRAALVALLGLLLHNLVDFNLEVGGVAVAAVALVAVVERPRLLVRPRWAVLLAVATLLCSALVLRLCPSHEEDGARLRALAESAASSTTEVLAQGSRAARRHPLDSYLYATVATRLWHDREPAAVQWVNLALQANPRDLLARRTSALLLAEAGHRGQALRTLALAVGDGNRAQRRWLWKAALTMAPTPTELLTALPEALPQAPDELPVDAGLLADELLELLSEPGAAGPPWPLLRAVAEWGREHGAATALVWLGRAALAQHDPAAARDLLGELTHAGAPPLLLADLLNLLLDAGLLDEAARLARPLMTGSPPPEVLLSAARLAERRGELTAARALLDTAQATASPALRARVHEVRAELEERAGNLHRAQLERAAAAAPPHP